LFKPKQIQLEENVVTGKKLLHVKEKLFQKEDASMLENQLLHQQIKDVSGKLEEDIQKYKNVVNSINNVMVKNVINQENVSQKKQFIQEHLQDANGANMVNSLKEKVVANS
jgi:hypothetical protein